MQREFIPTKRDVTSMGTRGRIIAAAGEMLDKFSYSYLTVRNICEAAGVSTGTFYHHFGNKDTLMATYLDEAFDTAAVEAELSPDNDVRADILKIYELYLEHCLHLGIDFLSSYYTPQNKVIDTRSNYLSAHPIQNKVAQLVLCCAERGRSDGYIQNGVDAVTIMNDICVIAKGVIFEWCLNGGRYDMQLYMKKMLGIYLDSVVTPSYRAQFSERSSPIAGV